MNQEDVFRVFLACIAYGKEIIAQGDEWRLPGLGKIYCTELPERTPGPDGRMIRTLYGGKKKVKCKFASFKSATESVKEEESGE